MMLKTKTPAECSAQEINAFMDLVLLGRQVDEQGLEQRVRNAELLGYCYEGAEIVGVAALKHPNTNYRNGVFQNSGDTDEPEQFPLEYGWAFVLDNYRGQGISERILEQLAATAGPTGIFATTTANNFPMQTILSRNGFTRSGHPYQSQRQDQDLLLYIRKHQERPA